MDLFSYNSANGHLKERVREGVAKHVEESGFSENWGESLRLEIDEGLSISKLIHSEQQQERTNTIMELYDSGEIPNSVMEQYSDSDVYGMTTMNYSSLARWVNNNLDTQVLTDEEIQANTRDDLKMKRGLGEEVFNRANWWGKFGQFAGSMHALALDPVYIPTYMFGIGAAAKGAGWLGRTAKAAAVVGGLEVGVETAKQPFVYNWKKDIGVDYNFGDAFAQIAMAGAGGAGITAVGMSAMAFSKNLLKFTRKTRIYGNSVSDEAVRVVENTARETGRMPEVTAQDGLARLEGEVQAQQKRNSTQADQPVYEEVVEAPAAEAPKVAEGETPAPDPDMDRPIVMETMEGDSITTTVGKVVEDTNTLEMQIEAARGCMAI